MSAMHQKNWTLMEEEAMVIAQGDPRLNGPHQQLGDVMQIVMSACIAHKVGARFDIYARASSDVVRRDQDVIRGLNQSRMRPH